MKKSLKYLVVIFGVLIVSLLLFKYKFEAYPYNQEVLFRNYQITEDKLVTTDFISPYNDYYGYRFDMYSGDMGVRVVYSDESQRYNLYQQIFVYAVWRKYFNTTPPFLPYASYTGCPASSICLDAEQLSDEQKSFVSNFGFTYYEHTQTRWVCNGACHSEFVKLWKMYYISYNPYVSKIVDVLKNYDCKLYFANSYVDCRPFNYDGYDLRWIVTIPLGSPKADGNTIYLVQKFTAPASTTTTTTIVPVTTTTVILVSPPPTPNPPIWDLIISKILDWLINLFNFFKFEIYGEQYPTVGNMQTYTINITTTPPDSDYSDGSYQVQYGSWALLDKSGNMINKGDWEQINGSYYKQITLTIPSNPGDYIIVGLIYQYDMKFNTTTLKWDTVSEGVVSKEAMNLNAKVIAPPTPKPPDILQVLKNFWCWFIGLFGLRC